MRERKYVKFRVDMLSDTKAKIIDRKPERDLIHYVWLAIVILAGKVNLEGELYLSKNIPYTIETLAIEFNREIDQVKLALDVLIGLEMIELTKHNIYIVKNFAKHQNIKVKDRNKSGNDEGHIENKEVEVKSPISERDLDNENGIGNSGMNNVKNNSEDEIQQGNIDNIENKNEANVTVINKSISELQNNAGMKKIDYKHEDNNIFNNKNNEGIKSSGECNENNTILLESKKSRKRYKNMNKNNINTIDEDAEDKPIGFITEGEENKPLGEGEQIIAQWSF